MRQSSDVCRDVEGSGLVDSRSEPPPTNSSHATSVDSVGGSAGISSVEDSFGLAVPARPGDGRGILASGARCGGCTVVRLLAEGGMGRVYEARQDAPDRAVAVKVIREELFSGDLARRFDLEAELLGRLRHPAIAQVHAAGIERLAEGVRSFIVMELVDAAMTVTAFAAAAGLGPRDRVALFTRACSGVAHAHERGIIHRDIKPANVLVDRAGHPKLVDFGVGRSVAGGDERLTSATRQGELLGTVRYMSPEQLGVGHGLVDARSDVYSLGLVLHELVLGDLPHELTGRTVLEAACALARSSGLATKPLSLRLKRLGLAAIEARSLAAIVATCLEPSPADRYPSAAELEADLGRWLAGEPVRARPPALGELLARLARRHRAAVIASVAVVAALAAAAAATTTFWLRAERALSVADDRRREADARTADARRQLYLSTVLLAAEARDRDNLGEARRLLEESLALVGGVNSRPIELECLAASLDESLTTLTGDGSTVAAVAWSPDGTTAAVGTMDGQLRTWRPADPTFGTRDVTAHEAAVWDLAFSPDGGLLASASADGTVRIHDLAGGIVVRSLDGHGDAVYSADFSPDGRTLATASRDQTIRLWDTSTWQTKATLEGHTGTVYSVRFSPTGDRLVSASRDGTLRVWNVAASDGTEPLAIKVSEGRLFRGAFSPDGQRVAAAAEDGSATVWDAVDGTEVARLRHPMRVNAVAFFASGSRLATASGDGLVRCWDVTRGVEESRRRGHAGAIWSLVVRPGDGAALTGAADGTARHWRLDGSADPALPLGDRGQALAIAADGSMLAAGDAAGRVLLADPRSLRPLALLESAAGRVNDAAFSADSSVLAAACDDGSVHRWSMPDRRPLEPLAVHSRRVYCVAFSPDGRLLATGSEDRTVRLVDAATGAERLPPLRHPARVFGVAFHPDGTRLATACGDRVVRIWSLESGRELVACRGHEGPVNWVAFSPLGERLASASSDGCVRVWSAADGAARSALTGPARQVWRAAFSPDGGRIAATVADGTVQVWDTASGRPVAVLRGHRDQAWGLAFLPGGRGLATASWDGSVRLWGIAAASLADTRREAE